ncbi:MAG: hypothetical protein RR329_03425 [Mucinivorans sp.]
MAKLLTPRGKIITVTASTERQNHDLYTRPVWLDIKNMAYCEVGSELLAGYDSANEQVRRERRKAIYKPLIEAVNKMKTSKLIDLGVNSVTTKRLCDGEPVTVDTLIRLCNITGSEITIKGKRGL